jgi:DNA topoisomerase-2
MKKQNIKQLSQIDHVLHRPGMYIGSIVKEPQTEFSIDEHGEKFKIHTREYIPGLIKTLNEWIDNSIDEYVRTGGKYANNISVEMTDEMFAVSDNGRGIPNTTMKTLKGETKYQAEVAFTEMLSGANYDNNDEATIGTNGLGSKAGSIFSKKTIIVNDDGKKRIKITTKNNLKEVDIQELKVKSNGIYIKVYPDFKYFGVDSFDETHIDVIRERIIHLSIAYPGIKFRFNKKLIKLNQKKYFEMFQVKEITQNELFTIGVTHADSEQFEHFSLVNGIVAKGGGRHITIISNDIITPIREKLIRKFKTIQPADIRNKLRLVVVMNNFMNAKWDSQTKEVLKNSDRDIKEYLNQEMYKDQIEKLVKKILKNDDIMLPITELFLLKEQAKENAKMKKLSKKKKIVSEKYLPATKNKKVLLLCEGASAVGGLMPALGREEYGYYELKGVPLNAYDATREAFMKNPELSELYQIIQNENYQYIITATDADADGSHIKGLLLGFFQKYLSEYIIDNRFGELQTPVQAAIKNKKPVRWIYELGETLKLNKGEVGKFYKGLGSWKPEDLKKVVQADGIENMISLFEIDDHTILDNWMNSDRADVRKVYLTNNEFDITGI